MIFGGLSILNFTGPLGINVYKKVKVQFKQDTEEDSITLVTICTNSLFQLSYVSY